MAIFFFFFFFFLMRRGQLSSLKYYVKAAHQVCLTCLLQPSDVHLDFLRQAAGAQWTAVCSSSG